MALDGLSGYSALIDNATATAQADKTKNELGSALSSTGTSKTSTEETTSKEKLMSACKQFEAYLWEQVYKEMKNSTTTFGDSSDSNDYGKNMVNLFMDQAIETVSSESVTEGPNSLAQSLYDQLKRNYNIED
jgi:flagellar protein FlgJ